MVVVRPWKLFSQTMISAWSCGMPLRVYPQRRAALMAVSTASAPVFIGSTISMPHSLRQFLAEARQLVVAEGARRQRDARRLLDSACRMRGWQWPWLSAE